jgi:hypothetical protein
MNVPKEWHEQLHTVREHCGGDSMRELDVVRKELRELIEKGHQLNIDRTVLTRTTHVLNALDNAETFRDRLAVDEVLCDILNSTEEYVQ